MQFSNCIKTILTQAGLPECQENSEIVKKWFLFSNIHGICQKLKLSIKTYKASVFPEISNSRKNDNFISFM